jgi:hypothetical protein
VSAHSEIGPPGGFSRFGSLRSWRPGPMEPGLFAYLVLAAIVAVVVVALLSDADAPTSPSGYSRSANTRILLPGGSEAIRSGGVIQAPAEYWPPGLWRPPLRPGVG